MSNLAPNLSPPTIHKPIKKTENKLFFPSWNKEATNNIFLNKIKNSHQRSVFERDTLNVPSYNQINYKFQYNIEKNKSLHIGSDTFINKILEASEVLIIDTHIDDNFLNYLYELLDLRSPGSKLQIKIIGGKSIKKLEMLPLVINFLNEKKIINNFYCIKDKDFIHDRFMQVDDELWHFGGTVGGLQKGLSAFSTGWQNTNFDNLFQELLERKDLTEEIRPDE